MSAFIGPALLARLVADKVGKPVEEVEPILAAEGEVVTTLLAQGARVRALNGYFELAKRKATRRKSPFIAGFVKVPAKEKVVFRESRKTKKKK